MHSPLSGFASDAFNLSLFSSVGLTLRISGPRMPHRNNDKNLASAAPLHTVVRPPSNHKATPLLRIKQRRDVRYLTRFFRTLHLPYLLGKGLTYRVLSTMPKVLTSECVKHCG